MSSDPALLVDDLNGLPRDRCSHGEGAGDWLDEVRHQDGVVSGE